MTSGSDEAVTDGENGHDGQSETGPASGRENGAGKQLYAKVALLNAALHGDLKLAPAADLRFAAHLNSVVLVAAEFPQAAAHYPIVFSEIGNEWTALAVLGPKDGANAFVNAEGKWLANTYVPAFVRRYPFVLVEDRERNTFSLAADFDSAMISRTDGAPLYEDGKPTETAENALKFCIGFHNQLKQTQGFVRRMAEAGILVSRTAEVTLPGGARSRLTGFHVIDETVLSGLPDEEFLKLRRDGVLNLIYSHLWSMRSWNNLLT